MTTTRTGVLADYRLFWGGVRPGVIAEQGQPTIEVAAGYFCNLGINHNLHSIWILPGSQTSQVVHDEPSYLTADCERYDVQYKTRDGSSVPVYGSVQHTTGTWEDKRRIFFAFPEHDPKWMTDDESWALGDVETPQELLTVLTSVEAALTPKRVIRGCMEQGNFHIAYSPAWCGMRLMKEYLKLFGHAGWLRPADLSMLPDATEPGGFYDWKRPLTDEELGKKYIHFYDRNAQFPAAATGAELGEGTPVHTTDFNEKLPGVWRVTALPNARYDALPFIIPEAKSWVYTPTVQAMLALGYHVEVHEGWVWPVHHRALQDWAKGLWEGRRQLREAYGKGSAQEHMAKMIANRGLGWLDLGTVRQSGRDPEKNADNRPDWYNMIKSLARYRLVLKLKELADNHNLLPVMIVADNIAYVSDDPNPETAAPGLMIRKSELGGFKHDGTYLLRDVLPLLNTMDANRVRMHVKQMTGETYA
jgi:hypothetical protein